MWVIFKKFLLLLHGILQRNVFRDVLLSSAPDNHVAFTEVKDVVTNDGHHCLLCAFVHQVGLC